MSKVIIKSKDFKFPTAKIRGNVSKVLRESPISNSTSYLKCSSPILDLSELEAPGSVNTNLGVKKLFFNNIIETP